jgi:hypothetical protein
MGFGGTGSLHARSPQRNIPPGVAERRGFAGRGIDISNDPNVKTVKFELSYQQQSKSCATQKLDWRAISDEFGP